MSQIIGLLVGGIGIASLVCWIMEIVTAFKREKSPLLGILSIVLCGIGGFVIGWIKSGEWEIRNLMMIWTGLMVAGMILNVVLGAMVGAGVAQPAPGF